jgi:tryptophan halogenase
MEPDRRIRRIAIVGGGVAGWTTAAVLTRKLGSHCSIHIVEKPEPLVPGRAVASLPHLLELLRFLGVDQNDFIDKTQSTYSLGARFTDWSAIGESFWRPFGGFGALIERRPFHHYWHKARALGLKPKVELFSHEVSMALANRFIFPTNALGVAQNLRYALHVDAALLARYLRTVAERAGVIRLERNLVDATLRENGFIEELQFEDGGKLRADLFIDCTGARAALIGEKLGSAYEDWRRWLPCDRIVSAMGAAEAVRAPYVRVNGRAAGWSWRTSLQQCTSHGHVYASAHQSDDAAAAELRAAIGDGQAAEPIFEEFAPGVRRRLWDRNVVAVGASAGALDPVVPADLHLITNGVFSLLDHFPDGQFDPANMASYNEGLVEDFERIRDFTVLHYCLSRRDDSPFWKQCSAIALPDPLARRIEMYRATGRILQQGPELFGDLDWFWILEGMGVIPRDYDPLVDIIDFEQVKRVMVAVSQKVAADVGAAPSHDSFFAAANARLGQARKSAAPSPSVSGPPAN